MPNISPVNWTKFVQRLNKLGFNGPYRGGKCSYMVKEDLVLTIPNPHKKEIGLDLLSRILKQAGITKKEWIEIELEVKK